MVRDVSHIEVQIMEWPVSRPVSLLDLLQFAWVALHESMPLLVLLFDMNCSCASAKLFPLPLLTIGVEDRGAGVAAALPTLEKFAKMSHNQAENQPKVG